MRVSGPWAMGLVLLAVVASPLKGQILSPGRLAGPHAALEGVRNCTACHELRSRGVSRARCLECHDALARRIEAERGFHATLAEPDCAACHKDHLGEDYAMIRLDTTAFDHGRTGFTLDGAHSETGCRDCHRKEAITDTVVLEGSAKGVAPDRTFLGLPTGCAACHAADDPHVGQFPDRPCTDCHTPETWERAPGFDHDRARFPLTGRHRTVPCAHCHPGAGTAVRYRPVTHVGCRSCHDDVHDGAMAGPCAACHTTADWDRIDTGAVEGRFDHASTGFQLEGRHASVPCASCHDPAAAAALAGIRLTYREGTSSQPFPRPRSDRCAACHEDVHRGAFARTEGGGDCRGCHGQQDWLPATFDLRRHDRETSFALTGAHRVVACGACHRDTRGRLVLRPAADACGACHGPGPHGDQFRERDCGACHDVEAFRIPGFDHARTSFPLDGAHRDVPCTGCHREEEGAGGARFVRYTPLASSCRDCHGGNR